MKKFISCILSLFVVIYCTAQISVYVKFTRYSGTILSEEFSTKKGHTDQILLTTYSSDDETMVNIGSQSSGAGAGKITFQPIIFSKPPGANSPMFFSMMASGTPLKK